MQRLSKTCNTWTKRKECKGTNIIRNQHGADHCRLRNQYANEPVGNLVFSKLCKWPLQTRHNLDLMVKHLSPAGVWNTVCNRIDAILSHAEPLSLPNTWQKLEVSSSSFLDSLEVEALSVAKVWCLLRNGRNSWRVSLFVLRPSDGWYRTILSFLRAWWCHRTSGEIASIQEARCGRTVLEWIDPRLRTVLWTCLFVYLCIQACSGDVPQEERRHFCKSLCRRIQVRGPNRKTCTSGKVSGFATWMHLKTFEIWRQPFRNLHIFGILWHNSRWTPGEAVILCCLVVLCTSMYVFPCQVGTGGHKAWNAV